MRAGVAAKELEEETGLSICSSELVDLTALAYPAVPLSRPVRVPHDAGGEETAMSGAAVCRGVYPTAGGSDEFLRLLSFRKPMARAELDTLLSKIRGASEEAERISLRVVPFQDLWSTTPDCKSLCAVLLYEKLKAAGKLPHHA
jgi:ADP-sugar diphosphatase